MEKYIIKAKGLFIHTARENVVEQLDKIAEETPQDSGEIVAIKCTFEKLGGTINVKTDGDVCCAIDQEDIKRLEEDGIDIEKDVKFGAIYSYERNDDEDVVFEIELNFKKKKSNVNLQDELDSVKKEKVDAGIITEEDFDRNVEVLRDNFVSDDIILKVVKTYEKQKRPVKAPHTIYREYDEDSLNFSLLVASSLCGQANILKGEKSTGKNACAETLAMVLNLPYFCIGLNSQTCDEEMSGTKNTDNTDVDLITQELAKDYVIYNNAEEYSKLDDTRKKEVLENASKYQQIKDRCASVHIIYETTPYIHWLEEGGVLCINEINMGAPNFLQKFLNSILDNTGFIEIPGYGKVEVNKNCILIGTENENYIGTNKMNEATLSRFGSLIFKNPEDISEILKAGVEDYAKEVDESYFKAAANFFKKTRETAQKTGDFEAVSIRGLIAALNQFAIQNYDFKSCVEQHVANHCTDRNAVYGVIDEVIME